MKYMHFNSSCSYAGLANQLEMIGIDTEDTEIVTKIGLPYCIDYQEEDHTYLAGAMLQGKKWFDLYLTTYGKEHQELLIPADKLLQELKPGMMLGIEVAPGQKHAVVFLDKTEENYIFINNKWEHTQEPERFCFSEKELLERVPNQIVLGFVADATPGINPPVIPQNIPLIWEQYLKDITAYVSQKHSAEELRKSMNPLFRPLLVDALAMMQVVSNNEMASLLQTLQGQYLSIIKKQEDAVLAEVLDMQLLKRAVEYLTEQSKELL